jgi:hypothetical protein
LPRSLSTLQATAHEQPAPTIRAGIVEYAKGFVTFRRVLSALKKAKSRINLQVRDGGVSER